MYLKCDLSYTMNLLVSDIIIILLSFNNHGEIYSCKDLILLQWIVCTNKREPYILILINTRRRTIYWLIEREFKWYFAQCYEAYRMVL